MKLPWPIGSSKPQQQTIDEGSNSTGTDGKTVGNETQADVVVYPKLTDYDLLQYSNDDSNSSSSSSSNIHLIVLIHGIMGSPKELLYLQSSLLHQSVSHESKPDIVLVHSVVCNHGKTTDGIRNGGTRISAEVNAWMDVIVQQLQTTEANPKITLSFVGNSLGGLYARFAIAKIQWNENATHSNEEQYEIHPGVFATTVTPHLGTCRPHTYVRHLPRWTEYIVANTMLQTGNDLFRMGDDDLLYTMATSPDFLRPLSKFTHRICYSNAYGTDFQVPCSTGAFLCTDSDSSHTVLYSKGDEQQQPKAIVCIVETEKIADLNSTDEENGDVVIPTTEASPDEERLSTSTNQLSVNDDNNEQQRQNNASIIPDIQMVSDCSSNHGSSDEDDDDEDCTASVVDATTLLKDATDDSKTSNNNTDQPPQEITSDDDFLVSSSVKMSKQLDQLGWTKVICDLRTHLPGVDVPKFVSKRIPGSSPSSNATTSTSDSSDCQSSGDNDDSNNGNGNNTAVTDAINDDNSNTLSSADDSTATTAGQLHKRYAEEFIPNEKFHVPRGHAVMVANSKSNADGERNKDGRPIMDHLANEILSKLLQQ